MNLRKVLIAVFVALAVLGVGYFFSWQSSRNSNSPEPIQNSGNEIDRSEPRKVWRVRSQFNSETTDEGRRVDRADSFLKIPGKVRFPEQIESDSVQLKIKIIPFRYPIPSDLRKRIKSLPEGRSLQELINAGDFRTDNIDVQNLVKEPQSMKITTNNQGRFTLLEAPPGLYKLHSIDPQWKGSFDGIYLETPNHKEELTITVRPSARFEGIVHDQSGKPLEGVNVKGPTNHTTVQTGKDGKFLLTGLNPGRSYENVRLFRKGYGTRTVEIPPLEPGETKSDTFVLKAGRTVVVSVKNEEGDPVPSGAVSVWQGNGPNEFHGEPDYVQPVNDQGVATLKNVPGGTIKLQFEGGEYLSSRLTRTLSGEHDHQITLEVRSGREIRIRYRDESSGRSIRGIQPVIYSFDSDNNLLRPSFKLTGRSSHELRGLLHNRTEKFLVYSRPRNTKKYLPKTTRHDVFSLPDITIRMVPQSLGSPRKGRFSYYQFDLREPGGEGDESFKWTEGSWGSFSIVDKQTAQQYLSQGRRSRLFENPIPVPAGSYYLFATIERDNRRYSVFESIKTSGTQRTKNKPVTPFRAASATGSITYDESAFDRRPRVAIYPTNLRLKNEETIGPYSVLQAFVPSPLVANITDEGTFQIQNLPANRKLTLSVILPSDSTRSHQVSGSLVVRHRSVGPIQPGQSITLDPIKLSTER